MSQQALAVIGANEWQTLQQQATALVASGFLPQSVNHPQKAVAIMMLGRELGIAPWAALTSINVIQGKPTVSPQLMLALINRSGFLEDMTVADDGNACTVTMKRIGRTEHTFTFSMQDAAAMGLSGKDNWRKQAGVMRQWRAVAGCARIVFADVILGLYTPDEMGADVIADSEGNMTIIEVKPEPVTPPEVRQLAPPDSASIEDSSASVRGAGIPTTPPEPMPADAPAVEPATVGSLDMGSLMRRAYNAKLVEGKNHFDNTIRLLKREGKIGDMDTADVVLDAIRAHKAERDFAAITGAAS